MPSAGPSSAIPPHIILNLFHSLSLSCQAPNFPQDNPANSVLNSVWKDVSDLQFVSWTDLGMCPNQAQSFPEERVRILAYPSFSIN